MDLSDASFLEKYIYFTKISGRNGTVHFHETVAKDAIAATELVKLTLKVGLWNDDFPNPQKWMFVTAGNNVTFKADDDNKTDVTIDGYVFIDGA